MIYILLSSVPPITFFLTNIKCNGCAQTIKKALSQEGIENIEIIFDANNSHIKREIRFE